MHPVRGVCSVLFCSLICSLILFYSLFGPNERKRTKYAELVAECQSKGWKARHEPIEVGCWGFAGRSLQHSLKRLGVKGQQCRRTTRKIMEAVDPEGGIHGRTRHLDMSQGLITLGSVARGRVSDDSRPETPNDPRFITEDVSK